LGFCKEKNTGSHDDVTRDSGRNGRWNGITLGSCRSKFMGSMDQLFEWIGKIQAIRELREKRWKSDNISGRDAYLMYTVSHVKGSTGESPD
jgi:hypothetical protein